MLRKISIMALVFLIVLVTMSTFSSSFAVTGEDMLNSTQATELVEIKEGAQNSVATYVEKYGSTTFGVAAYILNLVRIYSIPLCFVGIAIGSIYQYVLGVRKLDVRDKGYGMIIGSVTLLVICQILPLIFTIVVKGWRG